MTQNKFEKTTLGWIVTAILFTALLLGMAFLWIFGREKFTDIPKTIPPTITTPDTPALQRPEATDSEINSPDLAAFLPYWKSTNGKNYPYYHDIYMSIDHQNDRTSIYIKSWKLVRSVPFSPVGADAFARLGSICWYVIADGDYTNPADTLTMAKLTRQSEQAQIYTIRLPHEIAVGSIHMYFYDQDHGSIFLSDNGRSLHTTLLQTSDGGKTWRVAEDTLPHPTHIYKSFSFARFISEDVGIISYNYYINTDMSDRTYFTRDGGQTWERLPELPYQNDYGLCYLYDFVYANGEYVLTVDHQDVYEQYSSPDLESWTFVYSVDSGK